MEVEGLEKGPGQSPAEDVQRGKPGRPKGVKEARRRKRRSFGPYKFDKVTAREFIKNIKIGCPIVMAAGAAGVSVQTVYDWLRKGKNPKGSLEMQAFRRSFKQARHFSGKQDVKTLFAASVQGNIAAAQFRLRTRYPKYFGMVPSKVELTGANGGPIETNNKNIDATLTDEQVKQKLVELAEVARNVAEAKAAADQESTGIDISIEIANRAKSKDS